MCGIAGFWSPQNAFKRGELESIVGHMTDVIAHRGPDSSGVWARARTGIALGHRRLSILDLSSHGHQPMTSCDGRFVMVFNGEIYNFEVLRSELGGTWRGHSDSEVALEAISRWGIANALERFNGMFAIAVWDRESRTLTLARDRIGIKPLYWGRVGNDWVFGSEVQAIRQHPRFEARVDRAALSAYMRFNCIPAPLCIWDGLRQLEPGCLVEISAEGSRCKRFWSGREVARHGLGIPFEGSASEAVAGLESRLNDAVQARMVSDVPLGAFLSGGVDSSVVVSLMQAASSRPVKTFSIGFHDQGYNEAEHAKEVARHLGTDHTELYVTPEQALSVVEKLPRMYSEPFSDSSQIPTFLVCEMAREHVSVSLSGDGGDELFAGYNRHTFAPKVWRAAQRVPLGARRLVSGAVGRVPASTWRWAFGVADRVIPGGIRVRLPAEKLQKLARVLPSQSASDMYTRLTSHWEPGVVIGGEGYQPKPFEGGSFSEKMMLLDLENYLPSDILTKVDRASMAVSLEARVPLLDHRVVEFAWSLPLSFKLRDGQSKWVLRQVLYKHVPRELIERPKMGFGVPIDAWLRGPLKDWAHELLRPERLEVEGFFSPDLITQRWREHQSGVQDWQHHLWDVLMFQAWLQENPAS